MLCLKRSTTRPRQSQRFLNLLAVLSVQKVKSVMIYWMGRVLHVLGQSLVYMLIAQREATLTLHLRSRTGCLAWVGDLKPGNSQEMLKVLRKKFHRYVQKIKNFAPLFLNWLVMTLLLSCWMVIAFLFTG